MKCNKCDEEKTLDRFYGRNRICKDCYNKRTYKWGNEHPDKIRQIRKRWRSKNKEKPENMIDRLINRMGYTKEFAKEIVFRWQEHKS